MGKIKITIDTDERNRLILKWLREDYKNALSIDEGFSYDFVDKKDIKALKRVIKYYSVQ